jgi:hypothetical protein
MIQSRKLTILPTAICAAVLLLGAAGYAEVTQEFHRTIPISSTGRISLDNVNGNVEITGWDRNEVQIDAVKRARDQQRLDDTKIEVENSGDSVDIKTRYASHLFNNNPGSVDYKLRVPKNARLNKINLVNGSLNVQKVGGEVNADLVNGKIHASDLSGRANLSTVNGSIEANYQTLSNVSDIRLKSVNGSVELGLPNSPNAEVEASTTSGSIRTEFPLEVKGGFMQKNISGTLGSGGTKIELSDVNGSIRIAKESGSL